MMQKRKLLALAAATVWTASAAPAWAQSMQADKPAGQQAVADTAERTPAAAPAEKEQHAADAAAASHDHHLGDTVVTATRRMKRDLDVPAATMIITGEAIRESGASDAAEALAKVNGFTYKSFGANGASMGTMVNELSVRGFKSGTLVLLNGNPISWRGKYNLDQIPADSIERIEVVKGAGSVLYGSDAMSGIVNIITKKGAENTVHAGFGNFGQREYGVRIGDKRFSAYYNSDKWGHQNDVAESDVRASGLKGSMRTDLRDAEKTSAGLTYRFNSHLDFLFGYYETEATYLRFIDRVDQTAYGVHAGDPYHVRHYTTQQYITQLNYHDRKWKGSLYFNTGTVGAKGRTDINSKTGQKTPGGWYETRERNQTYGAKLQRTWKLSPKSTAVLGLDMEHETYASLLAPSTANAARYMRNNWGAFGQWEQKFTARDTGIIGVRETWTTAAARDENYHNFSASGQWLHKLDRENSLYLSASQSFIMPTFAQMYGESSRHAPAPDLRPQTGVTYELGWKARHAGHTWKAALFHMRVKDNITPHWVGARAEYQYTNEDFRNTGLELSCETQGRHGFSWNWGLTWQNPETRAKGADWERTFGKLQLTGGVLYKKGKWSSALNASYLASRVQSPLHDPTYPCRPYLLTSWSTAYHPDARSEIRLTVDNVLDRADVISHTGANYRVAPTSWMLSCNYVF